MNRMIFFSLTQKNRRRWKWWVSNKSLSLWLIILHYALVRFLVRQRRAFRVWITHGAQSQQRQPNTQHENTYHSFSSLKKFCIPACQLSHSHNTRAAAFASIHIFLALFEFCQISYFSPPLRHILHQHAFPIPFRIELWRFLTLFSTPTNNKHFRSRTHINQNLLQIIFDFEIFMTLRLVLVLGTKKEIQKDTTKRQARPHRNNWHFYTMFGVFFLLAVMFFSIAADHPESFDWKTNNGVWRWKMTFAQLHSPQLILQRAPRVAGWLVHNERVLF